MAIALADDDHAKSAKHNDFRKRTRLLGHAGSRAATGFRRDDGFRCAYRLIGPKLDPDK